MSATRVERVRAKIDRLPPGWAIALVGFLLQFLLAVTWLSVGLGREDLGGTFLAGILLGTTLLAGVASLPGLALLYYDRYARVGAALTAVVGVGTLVLNDGESTLVPFSAALVLAAVRAWIGAGLDAATLLRIDPDRFERVDPSAEDGDEPSGEGDDGDDDAGEEQDGDTTGGDTPDGDDGDEDAPNRDDGDDRNGTGDEDGVGEPTRGDGQG